MKSARIDIVREHIKYGVGIARAVETRRVAARGGNRRHSCRDVGARRSWPRYNRR